MNGAWEFDELQYLRVTESEHQTPEGLEKQIRVRLTFGLRITGTSYYLIERGGGIFTISAEARQEDPEFEAEGRRQIERAVHNTLTKPRKECIRYVMLDSLTYQDTDENILVATLTFPVDAVFPIFPDGTLPEAYRTLTPFQPILRNGKRGAL